MFCPSEVWWVPVCNLFVQRSGRTVSGVQTRGNQIGKWGFIDLITGEGLQWSEVVDVSRYGMPADIK